MEKFTGQFQKMSCATRNFNKIWCSYAILCQGASFLNNWQFIRDKITNKETQSNVLSSPPQLSNLSDTSSLSSPPQLSNLSDTSSLSSPPPSYLSTPSSPANLSSASIPPSTPVSAFSSSSLSRPVKRHMQDNGQTDYTARKRKEEKTTEMDSILLKTLRSLDEVKTTPCSSSSSSSKEIEEDEDTWFCRSIVPTLRKFTPRQNKEARIKFNSFFLILNSKKLSCVRFSLSDIYILSKNALFIMYSRLHVIFDLILFYITWQNCLNGFIYVYIYIYCTQFF